jgi:hypothetical protein
MSIMPEVCVPKCESSRFRVNSVSTSLSFAAMSGLSNHPAVNFTVRRPSPSSRPASTGPESDSSSTSFRIPAPKKAPPPPSPLAGTPQRKRFPAVHHDDDSDDEDPHTEDEIVTGFDALGVQRCVDKIASNYRYELDGSSSHQVLVDFRLRNKSPPPGPLVIPALQNRDWREVARKRKGGELYVPEGSRATIGADGSQGGLGTRDTINSGPQISGLTFKAKMVKETTEEDGGVTTTTEQVLEEVRMELDDEQALEQRALQALLSGDQSSDSTTPKIDIIAPIENDVDRSFPADETDAFRRDVLTRPDSATLDDYAQVPVEEFGAALLRGMGWKPGMAASRTRKGPTEAYVPNARPSLLGIGAKPRPEDTIVQAGGRNGGNKNARPERKYVPLIKREKSGLGEVDGSGSGSGRSVSTTRLSILALSLTPTFPSQTRRNSRSVSPPPSSSRNASRRASRSRSPPPSERRDRYKDRDRDRGQRDEYRSSRDRTPERSGVKKDYDYDDRERDSKRRDKDRDRDHERDKDRDSRRRDDGDKYKEKRDRR